MSAGTLVVFMYTGCYNSQMCVNIETNGQLFVERSSTNFHEGSFSSSRIIACLQRDILEIERGSTRSHCMENSLW
jgi:hypothetical protein